MSGPPASQRTSTPAARSPPTTRCSASSMPPTGAPSRSTRTCTPRSAAAARTDAIRSLVNVHTATSMVHCAPDRNRINGPSPSSGEGTGGDRPRTVLPAGGNAEARQDRTRQTQEYEVAADQSDAQCVDGHYQVVEVDSEEGDQGPLPP